MRLILKISDPRSVFFVLLLMAIIISVFVYSVQIRKPWSGPTRNVTWTTGHTSVFAQNYVNDGPFKIKFALLENPDSVEFPDLKSRSIYSSYPPGTIWPIYISSILLQQVPSMHFVMVVNLINHLLITLILSFSVYLFSRQRNISHWGSFIFALIPIPIELLMPGPLVFHQNYYLADQAILFPFSLLIFLEIIRDGCRNKRSRNLTSFLQAIVIFFGLLTEWLFVFAVLVLFIKRLLDGSIRSIKNIKQAYRSTMLFALAPLAAISLIILQIKLLDATSVIRKRFYDISFVESPCKLCLERVASRFWHEYIPLSFGSTGSWLIWVSLLFAIVSLFILMFARRNKTPHKQINKQGLLTILLLIIPCLLHTYFLYGHNVTHNYAALKFSLVLATVPFALIPITIIHQLRTNNAPTRNMGVILFGIYLLITASAYTYYEHPRYKTFFPSPNKKISEIGNFIHSNTSYDHVVFSPNYQITTRPPQGLSISMKKVYHVKDYKKIINFTEKIKGDYKVAIFFTKEPPVSWLNPVKGQLIKHPDKEYYYYIIDPDSWQKFISK